MPDITSRSNLRIKQVRALYQHKNRQEARLFLAEGIRHVGEAIASGSSIDSIYYAPERLKSEFALALVDDQRSKDIPCFSVSKDVFDSIAEKQNPQGILAVVCQPEHRLAELNPGNFPWGVAVIAPQDPGNVGTILRTIDAVGASGLILIDSTLDPYHPSAVRASMGTIFWYPLVNVSFKEFWDWSVQNSYHLYGSSARSDCNYLDVLAYQFPRILLLGSEREGLSEEQRQTCDLIISLPMRGKASSLNLSIAAGVLLYAMLER
jgi:TrmH family RNA methyltransferase